MKYARLPYDLEVSTPTGNHRLITIMVNKNCNLGRREKTIRESNKLGH